MELKQFNIKVVNVNPGDHQTQFTANRKIIAKTTSPYAQQLQKTISIIEKDEHSGLQPIAVAKKIYSILKKKNPHTGYVVSSFEQKLTPPIKAILPGSWFSKILEGHYGI
jgi:short-subunit dehydrogenase